LQEGPAKISTVGFYWNSLILFSRLDVSLSGVYEKIHIIAKDMIGLQVKLYYGSTSTKKFRVIIIGVNTPINNNGNKEMTALTLHFLPVMPVTQARAGAWAWAIAVAIRPRRS
jgi:hypothetical protein